MASVKTSIQKDKQIHTAMSALGTVLHPHGVMITTMKISSLLLFAVPAVVVALAPHLQLKLQLRLMRLSKPHLPLVLA